MLLDKKRASRATNDYWKRVKALNTIGKCYDGGFLRMDKWTQLKAWEKPAAELSLNEKNEEFEKSYMSDIGAAIGSGNLVQELNAQASQAEKEEEEKKKQQQQEDKKREETEKVKEEDKVKIVKKSQDFENEYLATLNEETKKTDKKQDDDSDAGFAGFLFGEEEDETPEETNKAVAEVTSDLSKRGTMVKVNYDGAYHLAQIRSYEPQSDTYTIMWSESGVLQYRTSPSAIAWDVDSNTIATEELRKRGEESRKEEEREKDELWLAARRGSLASVRRMIEQENVDINETGRSQNRTPFYHAVFCGHANVVEYLLAKGANDPDGSAFITANEEIREILQKNGFQKSGQEKGPMEEGRKIITGNDIANEKRRKSSVALVVKKANKSGGGFFGMIGNFFSRLFFRKRNKVAGKANQAKE